MVGIVEDGGLLPPPPKMPPRAEVASLKPEATWLVTEETPEEATLTSEETLLEIEEEIEDALDEVGFAELAPADVLEREKGSELVVEKGSLELEV